ncbi:hypothetical protein [Oceanobacillus luteolus]|uniref:Sigma-O factor regulatory protein RsoA n=1 Tax=Oceanobacillus luteolus TaxID=1274358 RepID=A0ABW4HSZ9_9BACI
MRANDELVHILDDFHPKIKKSLKNTEYQDREDLEQEINMKIIEKYSTIRYDDCPSIWELLK